MAVSPNTDFSAGQIYTAQQANNFPRGVMGYAISTTGTTVNVETDLNGMSITFTAVANRLYQATFSGFYQQGSSGRIFLVLTDGSNVQQNQLMKNGLSSGFEYFTTSFLFTASAGSTTRKIRASAEAGNATFFGTPADGRTYSFVIEDMGPA